MPVRDLRSALNAIVSRALRSVGFSGRRASASKRDAWWWLSSRARAFRRLQPDLFSGSAISFMPLGRVDLTSIDVPGPEDDEVTVRITVSAVSPGTERAQYLGLPNARIQPGHVPGFSAVGEVIALGAGVRGLDKGQRVAVVNCQHQSVVTVAASRVLPVPSNVADRDAGFVHLGVIALQGVELGEVHGRSVVVFGSGLIGVLAQRLAAVAGASSTVTIARSRRRFRSGNPRPEKELTTTDDADVLAALRAQVVIDATGDPSAIDSVVACAEVGGTVVLLGSSRGAGAPFPLASIQERSVTIIGAHVDTARVQEERGLPGHRRQLAESFLAALSRGDLQVDDLIDHVADPREPELLYRRLARDPSLVGAVFDWSSVPLRTGVAAWVRRADVVARGVDHEASALAPPRKALPQARATSRPSTARPLGVAIVGCGDIAGLNAAAIAASPSLSLHFCCDTNIELAADLARDHEAWATASFDEVLQSEDVDLVFLSVPHDLHAPLALRSIEAGKATVVEKPPAHRLDAAVRMVDAAQRAGTYLTFCLPKRYEVAAQEARRLLSEGALGDIRGASVLFLAERPPGYYSGGLSGRTSGDWRSSPDRAGGGITIMNLTHQLDLLLSLIQDRLETVSAHMASLESPEGVEDSSSISLQFASGATASLHGATHVRGTLHDAFRVWGDHGHLELEPSPRIFTLRAMDGYRVGRWQRLPDAAVDGSRAAFVEAVARTIQDGGSPAVLPDEALDLQAVIAAAYRSAQTGLAVRPADLVAEVRRAGE